MPCMGVIRSSALVLDCGLLQRGTKVMSSVHAEKERDRSKVVFLLTYCMDDPIVLRMLVNHITVIIISDQICFNLTSKYFVYFN